jgi:hypothetical protein
MNVMFVRSDSLIPFEARKVRTDVNWYVNLFASRSTGGSGNYRVISSRGEKFVGFTTDRS